MLQTRFSHSLTHPAASPDAAARNTALWLVALFSLLVLFYATSITPAGAAGVLTITSNTGPYAVFDANKPAAQSPGVFMVEAKVCNTGDAPLTDTLIYLGDGVTVGEFPDTVVGGVPYELKLLDEVVNGDVGDGTRYFSNALAPGDCVGVFWQVDYPNVAAVDGKSFSFTVWGTAQSGTTTVTDSESDAITTRSTISASANKINPLDRTAAPAGPYDIGEQIEVCYTNIDFGVIGNGENGANDFWFQPVGDTAFDPDSLTLVSTEVTLYTDKCTNDPYVFTDITYFGQIEGGSPAGDWDNDGDVECKNNSQTVSGNYCYTFVAIGSGSSTLNPYQQASSGNQQKFNGDYGTGTISVGVSNSCSLSLVKTADQDNVAIGDDLIYTLTYQNLLTDNAIGYPPTAPIIVDDAIPGGTTYQPGSATCSAGCVILYSTNGVDYSATPPVDQTTVTDLRFILSNAVAASGSGTVGYTVDVNTDDGVTAGAATTNLGGGATCTESNPVTTTPVTLAYVSGTRHGASTTFTWQTATETGTIGFNLYGVAADGSLVKLTERAILATGVATVVPQRYETEVKGWAGDTFYLEDIGIRGEKMRHGPFAVGQPDGRLIEPVAVDWTTIRAEHATRAAERQATARAAFSPELQATGAGAAAVDVHVDQTGLQRITYADLVDAGFDLAGLPANRIAMRHQGQPMPVTVLGGNTVGPNTVIEFLGTALDSLYTDTNVYSLLIDRNSAERIAVDRGRVPADAPVPFYLETVTVEEENTYSYLAPNGDPWYSAWMMAYGGAYSRDFTLPVDHLATGADAVLHLDVWGLTDWPVPGDDHRLQVSLNGTLLADVTFDGLVSQLLDITLPVGLLVEGDNTLTLTVPQPTDPDVWWDIIILDSYGVTYPRAYVAVDNSLTFTAAGAAFEVDGLTALDGAVYRVSADNTLTRLARAIPTANGDGTYRVKFRGSPEPATYYVSSAGAMTTPDLAAAQPFTDITSGSADYLMLAHPDFIDGLTDLATHHATRGLTVKIVDVTDVYAQFSFGVVDPAAIQEYIAHAVGEMGVQYVLLVGGDTYDYFDRLGLGSISFIPSLYGPTEPYVSFAPLDPLYADVDGDGVPDVPIGRFPVRTPAELSTIIAKTLAYAGAAADQSVLLAADDGFKAHSDSFAATLAGWSTTTAYLDDVSAAAARQTVLDSLNGGVRLTSFLGHSGPVSWTYDGLFSAADAASLTNAAPTVVTQWGCWNTYHVEPLYNTLGHEFMLNASGGAAAVLGAATLTQAASETMLGLRVLPRIVTPGQTLGVGVQAAKADLALTHPDLTDVLLGWTLLGDPALQIQP